MAKDEFKTRGRNRERIYYDILCSIISQEKKGYTRITRVQNEVNLPSDRLRRHLREMEQLRLLKHSSALGSTAKGRAFVSQYKRVLEVLKQFGLAD
ncbi:MAG: winged helix-turn-helix domain-containing protein [Candidatus Bathyarchaeia archaeon]